MDFVSEWKFLSTYLTLRYMFGDVYVERSPRRHGYHLIVRGVPKEAEYELRCLFGDDKNRIKFDQESEFKPRRILFQTKWEGNKRYDAEPMDERSILALPFNTSPPSEVFG